MVRDLFSFQVWVVSHRNCKRTSQSAGLSSIKGLIVSSGHVGIVDGKPAALGKEPVSGQDTATLNCFFVLSGLTLFSLLLKPCEKIWRGRRQSKQRQKEKQFSSSLWKCPKSSERDRSAASDFIWVLYFLTARWSRQLCVRGLYFFFSDILGLHGTLLGIFTCGENVK